MEIKHENLRNGSLEIIDEMVSLQNLRNTLLEEIIENTIQLLFQTKFLFLSKGRVCNGSVEMPKMAS